MGAQTPGHGSLHLFCMQANLDGQSVLITHSGRQPSYGLPTNDSAHLQDPAPFLSVHIALSPQGDGSHGELYSMLVSVQKGQGV